MTEKIKLNYIFITGNYHGLSSENSERRFMAIQPIPEAKNENKCEGLGCAYKSCCGRFLRKEIKNQTWASYYALVDDDCKYFEPVSDNKYFPMQHMLCNDCARVRDFVEDAHNGLIACECGGTNMCGCTDCIETANALAEGFLKKEDTGLNQDILSWNATDGLTE